MLKYLGSTVVLVVAACGIFAALQSPPAPKTPPTPVEIPNPLVDQYAGHLITVENGEIKPFDSARLRGVKYLAIYYSASWCPGSRECTNWLVKFYNQFKPGHPDFELLYVNCEKNEADMIGYMKLKDMPWPTLRYADINNQMFNFARYSGQYIPDLVMIDREGTVLADSYNGNSYIGPEFAVENIVRLLR